jgi:hypothetical protein
VAAKAPPHDTSRRLYVPAMERHQGERRIGLIQWSPQALWLCRELSRSVNWWGIECENIIVLRAIIAP